MLEHEIEMCNMLARTVKRRLAVVQVGSVICSIEWTDVESYMTVLYVTI